MTLSKSSYEFEYISCDSTIFHFISKGKKSIQKIILYESTDLPDVWMLSFGDRQEDNEIDYDSLPDNGDPIKILLTVLKAIRIFSKHYPKRKICFLGSEDRRQNFYQDLLENCGDELKEDFEIFGAYGDDDLKLNKFSKEDKSCKYLLLQLK